MWRSSYLGQPANTDYFPVKTLIPLLLLLLMAPAARSESVWLLLIRRGGETEKVEMRNLKQCQETRDYLLDEYGGRSGFYSVCQ